jgi:hypothetical protein
VVTASGDLPIEHAALKDGAVIITTALLPRRREPVDLISARRRGSYLFLRYRLGTAASRA